MQERLTNGYRYMAAAIESHYSIQGRQIYIAPVGTARQLVYEDAIHSGNICL